MTATQTKYGPPTIEQAFEQVKQQGEQMLTATRKAGTVYLESYEQAVDRAIEIERKFGELSQQEWLKNLIGTHVDFAREVADSYTTAARSLLK
jgi:hypothetical protein